MESYSESYRKAGVDITAGYQGVKLMAPHVERTMIPGVVSGIGGFGGLFTPDLSGMREPVLVSGTDGVGTKIRIAQLLDRHDTVGVDCVAMCVNDIICCGAKPLFFLDYIAIGKNVPEKVAALVSAWRRAVSRQAAPSSAERPPSTPASWMPRTTTWQAFPWASWTGATSSIPAGSGPVTWCWPCPPPVSTPTASPWCGRSFTWSTRTCGAHCEDLGESLGDALLTPTRVYVKPVLAAIGAAEVHGISHITGGGFYENLPRACRRA